MPPVSLSVEQNDITLSFTQQWLSENPLTKLDLEVEVKRLALIGFQLKLVETKT
jgi:hypothetical protein